MRGMKANDEIYSRACFCFDKGLEAYSDDFNMIIQLYKGSDNRMGDPPTQIYGCGVILMAHKKGLIGDQKR